ncbi:hypothetical protein [Algibacter mikhailovii]|uniref:Uncharacterized protein n=1 Tax=Algibacter mikhailovii TaxID=425498 RepID=A0A918R4G8_9FLAO|nr:hypothetical protein [Algibacter mikhailovii]GGZ82862.1 hypothetical protein GCM10007028_20890 [Algibacter mikhailovii]
MKNKTSIIVTRESVCLGDDVFSPHESKFSLNKTDNLIQLTDSIIKMNYLSEVQSYRTPWLMLINGEEIAIFNKNSDKAKFLVTEKRFNESFKGVDLLKVHFNRIEQSYFSMISTNFKNLLSVLFNN